MRLLSTIFLALTFYPGSVSARKHYFELDSSIRSNVPLCFSGYRIISPQYFDPATLYYFGGRSHSDGDERTLASQITALLSANTCAGCKLEDSLFISIRDLKFYDQSVPGEVMSLFIRADFFTGKSGFLHHIYSLDTFFQRLQHGNVSAGFVSECILQSVVTACGHKQYASAASLNDQAADRYYNDALMKYPLYSIKDPPTGIFRTIDDFINLRPVDTPVIFEHIPQMNGDGVNHFFYRNPDGSKGEKIPDKDFYAGSDGKYLWLAEWDGLHKIRKLDGELYFTITTKMLVGTATTVGLGPTGVLIGVIASGAKGHKENHELLGRFSPAKKRFVPSDDMRTRYR